MEETVTVKDSVGFLFKKFYDEEWKKIHNDVYSAIYNAYHVSTYSESFITPSTMLERIVGYLDDEVMSGKGWGYLPRLRKDGKYRINGKDVFIPTVNPFYDNLEVKLEWPEALLLYTELYGITREFMCYCGENGIDPDCKGKCIEDYGSLKEDYVVMYEYVTMVITVLKEHNVDITWLFKWDELKRITFPTEVTDESVLETLMSVHSEWWSTIGKGVLVEGGIVVNETYSVVNGIKSYLNEWYPNKQIITENGDKVSVGEHTYVSKPLISWSMSEDENNINVWTVESEDLEYHNVENISHWVFGPSKDGEVVIFENEGGYPGKSEIVFTKEPITTSRQL
tara:strand:+ start:471 stop:1487 length:1017 start_codon:yes stop_codon:yes gene_type:complete